MKELENTHETDDGGVTMVFQVHVAASQRGRKHIRLGEKKMVSGGETRGGTKVPRIARLMALAIRFEDLVRSGEVEDHAALAAIGHVTPVRISQIASLNNLAPDIQEELLWHEPVVGDREAIAERHVRGIALELDWVKQRAAWAELKTARAAALTNQPRTLRCGAGTYVAVRGTDAGTG